MTKERPGDAAIELAGLTRRFGRTLAVDDLSMQVPVGSTFGLIGPNGAGKTTTIRMLLGLLRPTAGRARVLGTDVGVDPLLVKQRVGYVPEAHHMDRWIRVGQLAAFCRAQFDRWNDATCQELLRLFDLDVDKKVKQLSRGMLTKLSLVLAVAHEPEVLVLDEPLAGLDPLAREEFIDGVLRTLCERERTVLLSTHSLDDVQRLADTVGILYGGQLLMHANIERLLATTKRVRAVVTNGRPPQQVPDGTICQRLEGREWLVTIGDFRPAVVQQIRGQPGVEQAEVVDVGLEELFKDFVKGRRAAS